MKKSSTMRKTQMTLVAALAAILLFAAVGFSAALAQEAATTDAIAGTWYGNMHFANVNSVQRVRAEIPAGCNAGDVCGSLHNYPINCTWELTYDGKVGDQYLYHFSGVLQGVCGGTGSRGTLQLLGDGSLYRTHMTPNGLATGILKQRPNAD